MRMGFWATHGSTFWVVYVCLVPPEVDSGNGENEERSGTPKNVLDCHDGRRTTRPQPDRTIVCMSSRDALAHPLQPEHDI